MINSLTRIQLFGLLCGIACLLPLVLPSEINAQGYESYQPKNREFIRGDMPPGVAADITRLSNPKLNGHLQPVQMIGPIGSRVEVSTNNGYTQTNSSRVSVGLQIGPVYRFKVTNIPRHYGKELYPSIEVLGKLNPPKGLENEFPIQVVMNQDDLEQALSGRLVTKVVYLENPDVAMAHLHRQGKQPFIDVGAAQDPLLTARKLGRAMAILRIGSRIPTATDVVNGFNFYAPNPTMLPDPQGAGIVGRAEVISPISPIESPPQNPRVIPGIVIPGNVEPIPNGNR